MSELVNADVIARGLSAFNPEGVAVEAGRIMLKRLRELAAARASFAFETTLASRSFAPWIRGLLATGYDFHAVYVWLSSADAAVQRVAHRVQAGGHSVPEATVRRRYRIWLQNFFELYRPLAATWRVYDNSERAARVVASGERDGSIAVQDPVLWSRIQDEAPGQMWRETAMKREDLGRIGQIMREGTAVDEAVCQAVREAVLEHVRAGRSIVVERNGKIVWLPPAEVKRELALEEAAGDRQATPATPDLAYRASSVRAARTIAAASMP